MFHTAFPDAQLIIEDIIAEGGKVVVRYGAQGTNRGACRGLPPTGKVARWSGVWIHRLGGGKIVEDWIQSDTFSVMQQLCAISLPEESGA